MLYDKRKPSLKEKILNKKYQSEIEAEEKKIENKVDKKLKEEKE